MSVQPVRSRRLVNSLRSAANQSSNELAKTARERECCLFFLFFFCSRSVSVGNWLQHDNVQRCVKCPASQGKNIGISYVVSGIKGSFFVQLLAYGD